MKKKESAPVSTEPNLKDQIAQHTKGSRVRKIVILAALGVLGFVGYQFFFNSGKGETRVNYQTEPAKRGTLVVKVSATGNLQPLKKVEISSELSGIVTEVKVDENDKVTKLQVLAQLDLAKLKDAVRKSEANLSAAQAQVLQAQATLDETRVQLARLKKLEELSGGRLPAEHELDTAKANLKRAEAAMAIARASVTQARANLQSDATNMEKATIRSPIDGVVLSRSVEPGQTVAASFQAPVLFTLAEDLRKMELQVDIDEADVGQVKAGQRVTFSVDAWPGREYPGTITRVALGSQTKDGVVSYPTVIDVKNEDLSLRPGMTGTAEIVTMAREDVLLVPNAALRFTPTPGAGLAKRSGGCLMGSLMPGPPRMMKKPPSPPGGNTPKVWVLRDGRPEPVEVKTGATDGQSTEITGGTLQPGDEVITDTTAAVK
ncbi:MAG: efflux RND transporter periplasmic adaptor subunit [Deltaproteobacteria bacterium HGW-Deltaproteobacteria-22]|jgi:HlyD family secretion protein|nr:MAG: efflux RND transporter periplasmic adaptor subunit [Deltaproteobacteria bacterium HGW-Deltaproteobacteria-22]